MRPLGGPSAAETCGTFAYTAVVSLEPQGKGTKYTALVIHGDEEGRDKHEAMGFREGWGTALDQLVAHMKAGAQGGSGAGKQGGKSRVESH